MSKEELLSVVLSSSTNVALIASSDAQFREAQAEKARLSQTLSGWATAVAASPGEFVFHITVPEGVSAEVRSQLERALFEAFAKVGISGVTVTSQRPTAEGVDPRPAELTVEGRVEE